MKRLSVLFTPFPWYLHPLRSTYPPQNPIHKHPDIKTESQENSERRTQLGYVW